MNTTDLTFHRERLLALRARLRGDTAQMEAEHHRCETMCAMTCCPCHLDIKKLKPLVRNPKLICKACGRVAAEKKHLCDPVSLG